VESLGRLIAMLNMMSSVCVIAIFCLSGSALWAQDETAAESSAPVISTGKLVYKSVDAKGNTIFTDNPPPNRPSEAIKVNTANTIPSTGVTSGFDESGKAPKKQKLVDYTLTITSPSNDELLGQDVESITLAVQLEPGLQDGDTFQLYYDGNPVSNETSYTVDVLDRGTHTVEAKIFDSNGVELKSADKVQFHVRRMAPLLNPNFQPTQGGVGPAGGMGSPGGAGSASGFGSPQGGKPSTKPSGKPGGK
jgi:hypothetical protein